MPTATKALRDVELVTVGDHKGSVVGADGKARAATTTVTRADLEAMLAAAADLRADAAPVKLGHDSSLNSALGDGEPAYGWVRPTRIGRNAAGVDTLYGDLVGMPSKLAEVAPAAFRRRSVEIAWDAVIGTKPYKAVLMAVALLGVARPAVKGLADVLALYTAPELREDHTTTVELGAPTALVAMLSAARELNLDPTLVAGLEAEVAARDTATVPVPTDDDVETSPQTPAPTPTPEAPAMPKTYTDEDLRKALSLEADADVDKALAELVKPAAAPGADATGGTGAASTGDGTPAPAAPAVTAPVAPAPELVGTATLSEGALAELQKEAAYGRARRLSEVLDNATKAGKITPAERGLLTLEAKGDASKVTGFAAALERDEAGTTALLDTMVARFATSELGDAAAGTEPSDKAWDDFTGSLGVKP